MSRYTVDIAAFLRSLGAKSVYAFVVDGKKGTGGCPLVRSPDSHPEYVAACEELLGYMRWSVELFAADIARLKGVHGASGSGGEGFVGGAVSSPQGGGGAAGVTSSTDAASLLRGNASMGAVRWRGSVSDLVTDLLDVLGVDQLRRLGLEARERAERESKS